MCLALAVASVTQVRLTPVRSVGQSRHLQRQEDLRRLSGGSQEGNRDRQNIGNFLLGDETQKLTLKYILQ